MKYTPLEEYFKINLDTYLEGSLENGGDFLNDYIRYQLDNEIYDLFVNYYQPSLKEQLYNKIASLLGRNSHLLDDLKEKYKAEVEHKLLFLSYPKMLSSLIKEYCHLQDKCIQSEPVPPLQAYYEVLKHFIAIQIAKCRDKIINQLVGATSVSIDDAIVAYMIYPPNKAHNIASHASAFQADEKKHSIEVLFDEYMLTLNDKYGLPVVKISNDGELLISIIPSYNLRKEFLSASFIRTDMNISVQLEEQSISDERFVISKIYKLFHYFDSTITMRNVLVFFYILKKERFSEFDFGEQTRTENKINELFIGNDNYYLFLALLHYLKIKQYVRNADNLSKSLGSFFRNGTSLKTSTITKYLSEKDRGATLENEFYSQMKSICFCK